MGEGGVGGERGEGVGEGGCRERVVGGCRERECRARVGEREGGDVTVYEAYGSNLHLQLV